MVVFKSVFKSYGDKNVLKDVSFEVKAETICGLMGKNGAGKSTLLNIIFGELEYMGEVSIEGHDPSEYKRLMFDKIFFLEDTPHVYDYLTPKEYVQFVLEMKGVSFAQHFDMYEELLNLLELKASEKSLIKNFSYGMKRKIKLMSLILLNPKLLIMDEPTLGLDAPSVIVFKRLIREFSKRGSTVVVAGHEPDFLNSICDQILILHNNVIAYENKNIRAEALDLNEIYMNIIDASLDQKISSLFDKRS